ncbi:MAG: primosomal protein N', partial [Erysipelothrix sp.]|nr:primosomal protein N' [Erysipelothrix sp.]
MIYVDVYIEDPFLHNEVLTYHSEQLLDAGVRVFVSVQQSTRIGFVKQSYEREELGFSTKPISGVVDDTPIINQELWELGNWMSKTTLNPIIRCFQAILPNQLRPSSSAKKKQLVTMVRVVDPQLASTPKQMEMIETIGEGMPLSEANKISSVVTSLIKKGALERFEVERRYQPRAIEIKPSHIELTQKQQDVLSEIDLSSNKTYLLHGITGSGKTEIYLQAAASVLASGKQVLILVPEISLTPQMISRFQKRFGQDIGIYHSGLNPQEKYEQYQRVQREEVSIVVGTRSAVFLPFKELGLIVMDEEHDDSFKQESTPFYHARDIALKRAQNHGCPLLLGSASPSLESYARAIKGNYQLLELPSRINNSLPIIKVIDTNSQLRTLSYQPLSNELIGALKHTLENHQQSILLLNRRSYAPIMKCSQCGHVLMCPNCETTLSYHKADQSFRCHTCDHVSFRQDCPECG